MSVRKLLVEFFSGEENFVTSSVMYQTQINFICL